MQTLTIPARFNGPPDSGNGGYVCGVVAEYAHGPVAVELRSPPPLDRPLGVHVREQAPAEMIEVADGDVIVARARSVPDLAPIDPPTISMDQARAAAEHYVGFTAHAFPTCFVCGPGRPSHDGLEIYPGALAGTDAVAAPWTPASDLAGSDGTVLDRFVWAALDCPSYFGCASGNVAVLARMQAQVVAPITAGEPYITVAWAAGADGRKHHAVSAIVNTGGRLLAHAETLWIELRDQ